MEGGGGLLFTNVLSRINDAFKGDVVAVKALDSGSKVAGIPLTTLQTLP